MLIPDPVDPASRYEAKTRELARRIVDRFPQLHRVELRWHGWFISADRWTPVSQRDLLRQLDVWLYAEVRHRLGFSRCVDRSTTLQDSPKLILSSVIQSHELRALILRPPPCFSPRNRIATRAVRVHRDASPIDCINAGFTPNFAACRIDGCNSYNEQERRTISMLTL